MGFEVQKELENKYVMPTFSRYPVEFVRGEGMYLFDSDGKQYLDFLSGIGVCSLGHCHPKVQSAIEDQVHKLIHVSNYFYIENRGEVAEKLSSMLGRYAEDGAVQADADEGEQWKTFFANSGAEANECAIKLARIHYKKHRSGAGECKNPIVVSLLKSFHGRTLSSLAATGQPRLQAGFDPIPDGFIYTPLNDIDKLRELFAKRSDEICAVMVECIQGESGINLCDAEFLKEIRRLCTESGALMICDEVQSGIFRTGRPFAYQHFGIVPDVATMAKGIASGVPCGACAARASIADDLVSGTHGSTFGGSNIAMSAALATLCELDTDQVQMSVNEVGKYLREELIQVPHIVSSRGIGLMCAAELEEGIDAHEVVSCGIKHGVIMNAPGDITLRLLPPLICTKDDVDVFISALAATLDDVVNR